MKLLVDIFQIAKEEWQEEVLRLIASSPTPYNLPYLLKLLKPELRKINPKTKVFHREYMKLWRFLRKCQREGLLALKKQDGLIWIIPQTPELLDLIKASEKFKLGEPSLKPPYNFPKRTRPERIEALKLLLDYQMLDEIGREEIRYLFKQYLQEIKNKRIILRRREDAPTCYPMFKVLKYITRFNSRSYKKKQLILYENIWKIASRRFKNAVFITLTTDPKRFPSLFHANRHFAIAFNRFLSYLQKYLKTRPYYLAVYEFTRSGLLHVHLILFGFSYVLHKHKLTEEWSKCGQGRITWIYSLKREKNKWIWGKSKPKQAKRNEGVETYLKKYLKKVLFDASNLFMYWCMNKRFFSYSRRLNPPKEPLKVKLTFFEFFGVFDVLNIPYVVSLYLEFGFMPIEKPPPEPERFKGYQSIRLKIGKIYR